jgi:tRNA threonylcarbamoyladenosine biosynthesis protein TsaE
MRLGSLLQAGDLVGLVGDLGSGKTTLVQGIAAGWGSLDIVSSPTFVLVNLYRRPDGIRFFHLDAYRLNSPREAMELDLDNMLERGPLVVEWAERVEGALPHESLQVTLDWIDNEQRDLLFTPRGQHYENLMASFRQRVYGG